MKPNRFAGETESYSNKDSRIRWLPFKVTAQEPNQKMTILLVPVQTFLLNETRRSFLFRKKNVV